MIVFVKFLHYFLLSVQYVLILFIYFSTQFIANKAVAKIFDLFPKSDPLAMISGTLTTANVFNTINQKDDGTFSEINGVVTNSSDVQ